MTQSAAAVRRAPLDGPPHFVSPPGLLGSRCAATLVALYFVLGTVFSFFLGAPRPLDGGGGLPHAAVSAADLGVLDPDGTVQAAFSSFDKDGSGGLDVHEIRREV